MLVLSRKVNETIVVDGPATVRIVEVRGKCVRVGIEADQTVSVWRGEVYEAIAAAHGAAR